MSRSLPYGWLLGLLLLSCSLRAEAEPSAPSASQLVGPWGLEGGRYVGSAFSPAHATRLGASLGYGYTEKVLRDRDRHDRLALELSGAYIVRPALQLSLASELRFDKHRTYHEGKDQGVLLATRVTSRHAFRVHPRIALAAEPSLLFPGAQNVGRGFRAISPSLSALATFDTGAGTSLGLMLGYRVDGSKRAVRDPAALSRSDLLAASISGSDSTLVGALFSYSAAPLTALVEWSWDLSPQGKGKAVESPMRVRAALQHAIGARFLPGIELGIDHSRRPRLEELPGRDLADVLARIEPRLFVRASLVVNLDPLPPPPRPIAPLSPPPVFTPTPDTLTPYKLIVRNEHDQPVAGARVQVAREGENVELSTDQVGEVTISLARGVTAVSIVAEGYEPHWQTLRPGGENSARVTLTPGLPAGEIKGAVRNLSGDPLRARIELASSGQFVDTGADGQFVINVAPGHYMLRIGAPGYEPQERPVDVELRGVTILVVDLRRAHP